MNWQSYTYFASVFIAVYLLVMGLLVYTINLPARLTGNPALVHEYYFVEPWKSLAMDLVFIVLYWLFAYTIWNVFEVTSVVYQGLIFVASTALLTTFFWWYFTRRPVDSGSFFSRWFHGVGARSVVYDIVLLGTLFVVLHASLTGLKRVGVDIK